MINVHDQQPSQIPWQIQGDEVEADCQQWKRATDWLDAGDSGLLRLEK